MGNHAFTTNDEVDPFHAEDVIIAHNPNAWYDRGAGSKKYPYLKGIVARSVLIDGKKSTIMVPLLAHHADGVTDIPYTIEPSSLDMRKKNYKIRAEEDLDPEKRDYEAKFAKQIEAQAWLAAIDSGEAMMQRPEVIAAFKNHTEALSS